MSQSLVNGWQSNRDTLLAESIALRGEGPQEIARFNQYRSQGSLLLFSVFFFMLLFFPRIWPSDLLAPVASLWHLSPLLNSCTSCIYRRPLSDISIWMAEALRLLRAEARIGSNHTAATIATPPNTLTSLKIQSSPVSTSRQKLRQKHLLQTVEGSCRKVVDGLFNTKRKETNCNQTADNQMSEL